MPQRREKKKRGGKKKGKKKKKIYFLSRNFGILSNSLSLFVVSQDPNTHAFPNEHEFAYFRCASERIVTYEKNETLLDRIDRKYSIG